jgi:23S rRNA pseudouridine1911/1915/1917 synthase
MAILYADSELVIYNKSVGEPAQSDKSNAPSAHTNAERSVGTSLHVVHRIDRRASGLLVFARSRKSAARLSELLREHQVDRRYLAIVRGPVEPASGSLVHRLDQDKRSNRSRVSESGKRAELRYTTVTVGDTYTLLEVSLQTGRHHQIRAQLAASGWPIRGDVKYGAKRTVPGGGIGLHGYSIVIPSASGSEIRATAPPPEVDIWHSLCPANLLEEANVTKTES